MAQQNATDLENLQKEQGTPETLQKPETVDKDSKQGLIQLAEKIIATTRKGNDPIIDQLREAKGETASKMRGWVEKWAHKTLDSTYHQEVLDNEAFRTEWAIRSKIADSLLGYFGQLKTVEEKMRAVHDLRKIIETEKRWADQLQREPKLVQQELAQRQEKYPFVDRNTLLETIKSEFRSVQGEPPAIQALFFYLLSKGESDGEAGNMLKVVKEKFQIRVDRYRKKLEGAKEDFPQKTVDEYMKWFRERKTWQELRDAEADLPKEIEARAKLRKEFETLPKTLQDQHRDRFLDMRRHEKETFLRELRVNDPALHNYAGTLLSSQHFGKQEKQDMVAEFKAADGKTRDALLTLLPREEQKRIALRTEFEKLPPTLRDDNASLFRDSSYEEKVRLLTDLKGKKPTSAAEKQKAETPEIKKVIAASEKPADDNVRREIDAKVEAAIEETVKHASEDGRMQALGILEVISKLHHKDELRTGTTGKTVEDMIVDRTSAERKEEQRRFLEETAEEGQEKMHQPTATEGEAQKILKFRADRFMESGERKEAIAEDLRKRVIRSNAGELSGTTLVDETDRQLTGMEAKRRVQQEEEKLLRQVTEKAEGRAGKKLSAHDQAEMARKLREKRQKKISGSAGEVTP